jgi:hypothetical protein
MANEGQPRKQLVYMLIYEWKSESDLFAAVFVY